MKATIFFILLNLCFVVSINAQSSYIIIDTNYINKIGEAGKLYYSNQLKNAIDIYLKCDSLKKLNSKSYFYVAAAYSKINQPKNSFYYLKKSVNRGLPKFILEDTLLFINIRNTIYWDSIQMLYSKKKHSRTDLKEEISRRGNLDQKYRFTDMKNNELYKNKRIHVDKSNRHWLDSLIKSSGLPKIQEVGIQAFYDLNLILLHSDMDVNFQLKMLKIIWESDFYPMSAVAYLQDRILINSGEKQLFGTQFQMILENGKFKTIIKPTLNKNSLNLRRWSMDLMPIEKYILNTEKRYNKR